MATFILLIRPKTGNASLTRAIWRLFRNFYAQRPPPSAPKRDGLHARDSPQNPMGVGATTLSNSEYLRPMMRTTHLPCRSKGDYLLSVATTPRTGDVPQGPNGRCYLCLPHCL